MRHTSTHSPSHPPPPPHSPQLASYVANWAHYQAAPHSWSPDKLSAPIVKRLDIINYAFAFFCPGPTAVPTYWVPMFCADQTQTPPFTVVTTDPTDVQNFKYMTTSMKALNPDLRIVISVGGWNFPSAYFSEMASSNVSRAAFVASAKSFIDTHDLDGIDLDWEYPTW